MQADGFQSFANSGSTPMTLGVGEMSAGAMRETELEQDAQAAHLSLSSHDRAMLADETSIRFWNKFLRMPLPRQEPHPDQLPSSSVFGRAVSAASRVLVTRDESGRERLNASYFLGALSLAAIHTSARPYWARSTSATFNDFGSTIGSDAGMNVYHLFEPDIRRVVNGLRPKFVTRIEARANRTPSQRNPFSISAR
jgi:hypothetical protein